MDWEAGAPDTLREEVAAVSVACPRLGLLWIQGIALFEFAGEARFALLIGTVAPGAPALFEFAGEARFALLIGTVAPGAPALFEFAGEARFALLIGTVAPGAPRGSDPLSPV
jgi:hypothetical protein